MLILFNLLVAGLLAAAAMMSSQMRAWPHRKQVFVASTLAVVLLIDGVLLAAYVFGEDSYRDNGTSRWEAYRSPGGALGPMFVVSIALLVTAAGLLAFAGVRERMRLLGATALVTSVGCVILITATILGFSLN